MRIGVALGVVLTLIASTSGARAQDDAHARFRATMNQVFGAQAWRVTGGYRTQAREDELRAQGALTVPVGVVSRHSMGGPGAPGAYDLVVDGLSPFQAAERLRRAGAPFRTIFAEGAHGSQGAHLHIDPYPGGGGKAGGPPGLPWIVASPTPAQQAITALRERATGDDDVQAQLELGRIYAQGRLERKNLVEAYVWTALAATNEGADAVTRQEAELALAELARSMSPEDVADARRFVPEFSEAAGARTRSYGPIIARPRAPDAIRIAQQGAAGVTVISGR